jgi:hypothetical protein
MATIRINSQELKDYLSKNLMTMSDLSNKTGRSAGFVSHVIASGVVSDSGYSAICKALGVARGAFTTPTPEAYRLNLVYNDSKVLVQLMRGDEVVSGAWAIVKEPGDLGFIQAISYAAHMMYKFAQQDDLNKEELA